MKVRNTLEMDKVWHTLPDKLENFVGTRRDDSFTRFRICNKFPRWQFNGADTFENIIFWCERNLGNNYVWNFETIYFKTEQDKAFFLLRWA
jgi:hypothetical protein